MKPQNLPGLNPQQDLKNVESYEFDLEPIRGYPELRWAGKRPFRSTRYFPAQLKDTYGEPGDGWMNQIFWGDNLQVMSHLLKKYRGQVQLIYIDPPFDSQADYKKTITLKGTTVQNDHNAFEEKQYSDVWNNDDYLQFMYERLMLMRELLADTGSIFLHCDDAKNFHLRCILDEIFSPGGFRNEIIWKRTTATGLATKACGMIHDTIYWYAKNQNNFFKMQYHKHEADYLKRAKADENGRMYIPVPTGNPGYRPNLYYSFKGYYPPENGYKWTKEKMTELDKQGRLVYPESKDGRIQLKQFLDEVPGVKLQDLWLDLPAVNPVAKERLGYPTQKPEGLLSRIISMGSRPGDLVFDCFMGSGTTQAVAMKLGRKFIGADINMGAIQTTTKRLIGVAKELAENHEPGNGQQNLIEPDSEEGEGSTAEKIERYYTGFQVYNVNNYDLFRNELDAKELLKQALEIQPLGGGSIYDGEKDGYMVKILSPNRIATKADLNPLISGFSHKEFEKRQKASPNKAVEKVMLVCMGHEPDLKAELEKQMKPFKLDIQIVDILRDREELQFKREAEAKITVKGRGKEKQLVIEAFYPMNLLQKLSMQKQNVKDWRELVDSVLIDWNYDGGSFQPKELDIPEKDELVKGAYTIPTDAGTIRVKITDLLAESLEKEVSLGEG